MSHPMIEVEHLSKQYKIGVDRTYKTLQDSITSAVKSPLSIFKRTNNDNNTFWALKDVSFDIEEGEVVGIIGRNGAGKSTLLKILSRITEPTEGKITMRGRVASLLEVGTGFHPELTGRENIYLNGSILGMKKREIDTKFDEIVKFAEIEKFLDTPVKRYSSGMYVRLAFAVAAHLEPEILLVDEVLAVGDAAFQKKCLGKMGEVAKGGRTVLFVSHNMGAVKNLCKRCILINNGIIDSFGDTGDIINKYLQQVSNINRISLKDRKDRVGNGKMQITNVFFQNANREVINSFISGEDSYFVLEYETKSNIDLNNVDVALSVNNSIDERIFSLYTEFTNDTFDKIKNKGKFYCYIPKLPLSKGEYFFTIFSKVNQDICDWVSNAGSFQVEDGDFFKTGKLQDKGQGYFLVEHKWAME